ncbi:hypothetical protein D1AOALGA4SA_11511 [Olavius algarvensis Delta 1 endosymbiont]|nr:hypothetical protein D1AOALGA4SA_11511 [Olavius algarvensis Delta 1 endosymbiont]
MRNTDNLQGYFRRPGSLAPGIRHPTFGIPHLVSSIKYRESSIENPDGRGFRLRIEDCGLRI